LLGFPEKLPTFAARKGGRKAGRKKGEMACESCRDFRTLIPRGGRKKINYFILAESKTSLTFAIPKRRGTRTARCPGENKKNERLKSSRRMSAPRGKEQQGEGDRDITGEPRGKPEKFF